MTLSKVPGATLEEIDAAIKEVECIHAKCLTDLHANYLANKAKARQLRSVHLKKLQAYRAVIELEAKDKGGDE